jgi:hypothetical protein
LSIHSEEIHNFDFNKPKMSKHLWLYEGITEYFAGHMQVKHGLIELPQYIGMIQEKMMQAEQFNDTLPFTVMSTNALDVHKDQYGQCISEGCPDWPGSGHQAERTFAGKIWPAKPDERPGKNLWQRKSF